MVKVRCQAMPDMLRPPPLRRPPAAGRIPKHRQSAIGISGLRFGRRARACPKRKPTRNRPRDRAAGPLCFATPFDRRSALAALAAVLAAALLSPLAALLTRTSGLLGLLTGLLLATALLTTTLAALLVLLVVLILIVLVHSILQIFC